MIQLERTVIFCGKAKADRFRLKGEKPGHRTTERLVFIVNNKMFFNQDRIEFIFREAKK